MHVTLSADALLRYYECCVNDNTVQVYNVENALWM